LNHFLTLRNRSRTDVQALVDRARSLKSSPISDDLHGKVVGLLFMNPSLRTLASFQAAVGQRGGTSFVIQPGASSWSLEFEDGAVMDGTAVEHVKEAIPVLSRYCDILGIRNFARQSNLADDLHDVEMSRFAALSSKPLINLESASDHPCQALADWMTLDELAIPTDGKFVLSWAWHPKPLPFAVPRASLAMAAQRGMEVVVHCPEGFDLPELLIEEAEALSGSKVQTCHVREQAMEGAHVLYCKSWCRPDLYGLPEAHQEATASLRENWCVDEPWFAVADSKAKFMHCLPVRRNVKVTDRVLDGPRSVVIQQAENRLHAQKSVILKLAESS
jgi:N-acetylornithine carbamoyltransferase